MRLRVVTFIFLVGLLGTTNERFPALNILRHAHAAENKSDDPAKLKERADQGDAEAVTMYRKAAERGNADAQVFLGAAYYNGQGVPQNPAEAVKWFRKAAKQGDEGGELGLGISYYHGQGVPLDYSEAAKWFRAAAEQGNTRYGGQQVGTRRSVQSAGAGRRVFQPVRAAIPVEHSVRHSLPRPHPETTRSGRANPSSPSSLASPRTDVGAGLLPRA